MTTVIGFTYFYTGGASIMIRVTTSRHVDALFWYADQEPEQLSTTLDAYANLLPQLFQKTAFLTALALLETVDLPTVASWQNVLSPETFTMCVREIEALMERDGFELEYDQENFRKWSEFYHQALDSGLPKYEALFERSLHVQIVFSEAAPEPPEGQLTRTDLIDDVLQVTMVIGSTRFEEKDDRKYPLTESWIHRGLQIAIMKRYYPFVSLEQAKQELSLTNIPSTGFPILHRNLLWYLIIRIFCADDELEKNLNIGKKNGITLMPILAQLDQQEVDATGWTLQRIRDRFAYLLNQVNQSATAIEMLSTAE